MRLWWLRNQANNVYAAYCGWQILFGHVKFTTSSQTKVFRGGLFSSELCSNRALAATRRSIATCTDWQAHKGVTTAPPYLVANGHQT
jgi:hypothetical protein